MHYSLRPPGYCEGFDGQYVGSPLRQRLRLVSLLATPLAFDKGQAVPVVLKSTAVGSTVNVRIVSVYSFDIYRLDGQIEPNGELRWDVKAVLGKTPFDAATIGITGTVQHGRREVFVPLYQVTGEALLPPTHLYATLKPLVPAKLVRWRLLSFADGDCLPASTEGFTDPVEHFLTRAPIHIEVPVPADGSFCIEVSAQDGDGNRLPQSPVAVLMPPSAGP